MPGPVCMGHCSALHTCTWPTTDPAQSSQIGAPGSLLRAKVNLLLLQPQGRRARTPSLASMPAEGLWKESLRLWLAAARTRKAQQPSEDSSWRLHYAQDCALFPQPIWGAGFPAGHFTLRKPKHPLSHLPLSSTLQSLTGPASSTPQGLWPGAQHSPVAHRSRVALCTDCTLLSLSNQHRCLLPSSSTGVSPGQCRLPGPPVPPHSTLGVPPKHIHAGRARIQEPALSQLYTP